MFFIDVLNYDVEIVICNRLGCVRLELVNNKEF